MKLNFIVEKKSALNTIKCGFMDDKNDGLFQMA